MICLSKETNIRQFFRDVVDFRYSFGAWAIVDYINAMIRLPFSPSGHLIPNPEASGSNPLGVTNQTAGLVYCIADC